jgi:hypothetical protein
MATNGPCRRRLNSWIWRATSSLPTPDSPSSKTVKSVPATRSIFERSACIASVDPMRGAAPSRRGFDPDKPARASRLRPRSISRTARPVGRHAQHLKIPLAEPAARIEPRFQNALRRRVDAGTSSEIDSALPAIRAREPTAGALAKLDRVHRDQATERTSSNAPRISATSPRLSRVRVSAPAARRTPRGGRAGAVGIPRHLPERDAVMV